MHTRQHPYTECLRDATVYTQAELNAIVENCLTETYYGVTDALRCAADECPLVMKPAEWVKACAANGIRENTARNRLSEVRKQQLPITRE